MADYNQKPELSGEILKSEYAEHLMVGGGTGGLVLVRGKGVRVEETVAIRKRGFEKGVIFGLSSVRKNILKIKSPLIINQQEADEVLAVLAEYMREVLRK